MTERKPKGAFTRQTITRFHRDAAKGAVAPLRLGHGATGQWTVFDATGRQLCGESTLKANMEAMLDGIERAMRMKPRKCLRCRIEFLSEGPHNRLCGCQHDVVAEESPYAVGRL